MRRRWPTTGRLGAALVTGWMGCQSTFYSATGNVMSGYTVDHVLPTLLASSDVSMACSTGLGFAAFLASFARVTDDPLRASLISYTAAGFCSEHDAREAELLQLRAVYRANASAAQDARIVEKRHHRVAATRFHAGFTRWQQLFASEAGKCPAVEPEDQALFLFGLAAGLNAVLHDRAANAAANVPLDIPAQVAEAANCLDNSTWFGIPKALQAAAWAGVPGLGPNGSAPFQQLEQTAQLGDRHGLRLARGLQVQALASAGRAEQQRLALSTLAAAPASATSAPYALLDAIGLDIAQHESDKLWTSATGHRTEPGKFGSVFSKQEPPDLDDGLLDNLTPPNAPALEPSL